ncbi:hypothetical protein SBRCBS47491_007273 [Sporothrix bragantina]|uniref:Uncharacterized protein n=1 Tax=Sporothrix bragantina TaxID=671064 RepID=A0ABP0CCZ3_9PEZI
MSRSHSNTFLNATVDNLDISEPLQAGYPIRKMKVTMDINRSVLSEYSHFIAYADLIGGPGSPCHLGQKRREANEYERECYLPKWKRFNFSIRDEYSCPEAGDVVIRVSVYGYLKNTFQEVFVGAKDEAVRVYY